MSYKRNVIYRAHKRVKEAVSAHKKVFFWKLKGRPVPAPHAVKQRIVKEYAARFKSSVFIETGTFMGEMIDAVSRHFSKIISIEVDPKLAERAKDKFSSMPHITILEGDSGDILPTVIAKVNEPCLFWLDAHYSGGVTGQADTETPIIKEIKTVLNHSCLDNVVLIDDAREFVGNNNYPTLEELRRILGEIRNGWQMAVEADIIRMHK